MGDAILWMILWAIGAFGLTGLVIWIFSVTGTFIAVDIDKTWVAVVGFVVGLVAGASWFIFALVHSIESLVTLIQIASGG